MCQSSQPHGHHSWGVLQPGVQPEWSRHWTSRRADQQSPEVRRSCANTCRYSCVVTRWLSNCPSVCLLSRFKATLWLSESHPLSLAEQVTPIIDLMAISNAHFAKLRDFITLRLPPGFPVKIGRYERSHSSVWPDGCLQLHVTYYRPQPLGFSDGCCCTTWPNSWSGSLCFVSWKPHCLAEIPLFHVLNARVTFSNLCGCDEPVSSVMVHKPESSEEAGDCCSVFYWFKKMGLSFVCAVILYTISIQVSLPLPSTVRWTPRCSSPQQTTPRSARAGANRWGTRMTTCCSSPSSRVCWTPAQRATRSELLTPPCLSAWLLASFLFADWPAVCPRCQMFCLFALFLLETFFFFF